MKTVIVKKKTNPRKKKVFLNFNFLGSVFRSILNGISTTLLLLLFPTRHLWCVSLVDPSEETILSV